MTARPLTSTLWPAARRERLLLLAILVAALILRLQVWRWHRLYPLGGDEGEYFNQALTLLQGKGYHDLPLMRPPLYPVFLAGLFQLFDSQVQRVRLVQALISTAGVYLQWLLARLAFPDLRAGTSLPLVAAALAGFSFTLAANATELLAETVFLFGLSLALCLLVGANRCAAADASRGEGGRRTIAPLMLAVMAGIGTGLLALVRSVALPLLPLGALWLLLCRPALSSDASRRERWRRHAAAAGLALAFGLAGVAMIAPWTARNYLRYGAPIVVDTTGAENLWLDNDPAGREAVKQALYALGEDRAARQSLSMERGLAVILEDPGRFLGKVGAEARKLVALEYWDDMRNRPAIWAPPQEVWLRLLLGDGIWLALLLLGSIGWWFVADRSLHWLLIPWALYIVATSLIFHVELRYRLPLYPLLGLGAAALLTGAARVRPAGAPLRALGATATAGLLLALLLLHRPYIGEGFMLGRKHWNLWRDDGAAALRADPESALARVALARDRLPGCLTAADGCAEAETLLREAIALKGGHPYPHLLLGTLLHRRGALDEARAEFQYETSSLEDLQAWTVHTAGPRAAPRVDIGDGLDLGNIEGFYPPAGGYRWTTARATVWLQAPEQPAAQLRLRVASGRPVASEGDVAVGVRIMAGDVELGRLWLGPDWQTVDVPVPEALAEQEILAVTIEAPTFRPRDLDRRSKDNRPLGIKVDWIEITTPEAGVAMEAR